ncbi:MAG: DUF3618 domain-containing protein [Micromonosporaceae bacterium]
MSHRDTAVRSKEAELIRQDIARTRAELGDTVAELADRMDVRKRVRARPAVPIAIAALVAGGIVLLVLRRRRTR